MYLSFPSLLETSQKMEDLRGSNLSLDIVKLFVGQIPKDMDEDSLRVYFEEFGPLAELSVIRDSANLTSKGITSSFILKCELIVEIQDAHL